MSNPPANPKEVASARLEQIIEAQKMWISALEGLNACYRIGSHRGADSQLGRIEKAKRKLRQLEAL